MALKKSVTNLQENNLLTQPGRKKEIKQSLQKHVCLILLLMCCIYFIFHLGIYKGHCFRINHFPEDNDYDHDSSEYLLRKLNSDTYNNAEN